MALRKVATELPKAYLSASAIDTYLICPQRWKLKYLDGLKSLAVPVSIIEGKTMHSSLEFNNRHKAKTEEDLPKEQVVEHFHDTWSDTSQAVTEWDQENTDGVHKRGEKFLNSFMSRYAKNFIPANDDAVEMKVEGEIAGQQMLGYVDLMSVDKKHVKTIVDYKVVGRAKRDVDVKQGLQTGIYSLLTGVQNAEFVCFVKTKETKIVRVRGNVTPRAQEKVANVVKGVTDAIKKGSFPYADPTSWACSSRYCGLWVYCKQGGKK